MADEPRPIIIKRIKRVETAHQGGAWKVAYADFVTAMMAFFLLMWLIGSTTEEQRQGLADYFSPSVGLPAATTGGDGPFGGSSMFAAERLAHDALNPPRLAKGGIDGVEEGFSEIEDQLLGGSGDAVAADPLLRHIRTRLADEGLIIEVFDIEGSPLFNGETDRPNVILNRLVDLIGRVLGRTTNPVAVTGHVGAAASTGDPWQLSSARAHLVREGLVAAGLAAGRIARVTGKADRDPAVAEPGHPRNRRIEITLLRRFASGGER